MLPLFLSCLFLVSPYHLTGSSPGQFSTRSNSEDYESNSPLRRRPTGPGRKKLQFNDQEALHLASASSSDPEGAASIATAATDEMQAFSEPYSNLTDNGEAAGAGDEAAALAAGADPDEDGGLYDPAVEDVDLVHSSADNGDSATESFDRHAVDVLSDVRRQYGLPDPDRDDEEQQEEEQAAGAGLPPRQPSKAELAEKKSNGHAAQQAGDDPHDTADERSSGRVVLGEDGPGDGADLGQQNRAAQALDPPSHLLTISHPPRPSADSDSCSPQPVLQTALISSGGSSQHQSHPAASSASEELENR